MKKLDKETGEILEISEHPTADAVAITAQAAPFFKTPYNHDTLAAARASATSGYEETLTQQNTAEECDINHILKKFGVGGLPPAPMQFLQIPDDLDARSAIERIRAGQEAFAALPRNLQQHFETMDNFVDFVDQRVNMGDRTSLEALGLIPKPPEPAPDGQTTKGSQGGTPVSPSAAKEPKQGSKD